MAMRPGLRAWPPRLRRMTWSGFTPSHPPDLDDGGELAAPAAAEREGRQHHDDGQGHADRDRDPLDVRDLLVDAALERLELGLDVRLGDRRRVGRQRRGGRHRAHRAVTSWRFFRVPSFLVSAPPTPRATVMIA